MSDVSAREELASSVHTEIVAREGLETIALRHQTCEGEKLRLGAALEAAERKAGELEAALRLVIEYDDAVLEWDAMPSREPGKREASDRASEACKAMVAAARALAPASPEEKGSIWGAGPGPEVHHRAEFYPATPEE